MISNKKVFITGGAGFIANSLINELIIDNQIVVYDNFSRDTLTESGLAEHPNIEIIKGDVLDFDKLVESMQGAQIVIHAAAFSRLLLSPFFSQFCYCRPTTNLSGF